MAISHRSPQLDMWWCPSSPAWAFFSWACRWGLLVTNSKMLISHWVDIFVKTFLLRIFFHVFGIETWHGFDLSQGLLGEPLKGIADDTSPEMLSQVGLLCSGSSSHLATQATVPGKSSWVMPYGVIFNWQTHRSSIMTWVFQSFLLTIHPIFLQVDILNGELLRFSWNLLTKMAMETSTCQSLLAREPNFPQKWSISRACRCSDSEAAFSRLAWQRDLPWKISKRFEVLKRWVSRRKLSWHVLTRCAKRVWWQCSDGYIHLNLW